MEGCRGIGGAIEAYVDAWGQRETQNELGLGADKKIMSQFYGLKCWYESIVIHLYQIYTPYQPYPV